MLNKHLIHLLIGANVLLFLARFALPDLDALAAQWAVRHPDYRHWQWFTAPFMHKDLLHLLFNMYGLAVFGAPLLQYWGARRFALLYFGGALAGALCYTAWQAYQIEAAADALAAAVSVSPAQFWEALTAGQTGAPAEFWRLLNTYALGASGAVFAVLAAFSLCFGETRLSLLFLPVSFPAKYFVAGLVAYEAFAQVSGFSLFGANIAHLAHIGGALCGWALAWYWLRRPRRRVLRVVK
nr:rhomboid family intramembrane serine protease [Conchiformibius kuhniae]